MTLFEFYPSSYPFPLSASLRILFPWTQSLPFFTIPISPNPKLTGTSPVHQWRIGALTPRTTSHLQSGTHQSNYPAEPEVNPSQTSSASIFSLRSSSFLSHSSLHKLLNLSTKHFSPSSGSFYTFSSSALLCHMVCLVEEMSNWVSMKLTQISIFHSLLCLGCFMFLLFSKMVFKIHVGLMKTVLLMVGILSTLGVNILIVAIEAVVLGKILKADMGVIRTMGFKLGILSTFKVNL